MRRTSINAPGAPSPPSNYQQAMLVEGARRMLFVSGQVPVTVAGEVPVDFEGQARVVWRNIEAQLHAADMTLDHLVKVTFYLSDRKYALANRKVREEVLGHRAIALTAVICTIFDETWLLEIEAVAAD